MARRNSAETAARDDGIPAALVVAMISHDAFSEVSTTELDAVTGGFNIGAIGQQIGGLVDSFTGGSGKGAQIGGQIGGLIQSFIGGGQAPQQAPQPQGPETSVAVQTGG